MIDKSWYLPRRFSGMGLPRTFTTNIREGLCSTDALWDKFRVVYRVLQTETRIYLSCWWVDFFKYYNSKNYKTLHSIKTFSIMLSNPLLNVSIWYFLCYWIFLIFYWWILEQSDVCDWLNQPTPCLYAVSKKMDWYSASHKCNQLHGYLVDRDAILHRNLNLSNVYYWTGLTRTRQIWTDGELM